MRIATYNVNGMNGRLEVLLRWLDEASPHVACLQELKAPHEKFPIKAIEAAGYGAVWQGQKSWNGVAILAKDQVPNLTRKGLPGDPDDAQSRYVEAIVDGVIIGALYLPNGNPYPGPKFEYKRRWFERSERWVNDALFRVEVRQAFKSLVDQGWTDALRTLHPDDRIYTFWDYFRNAYARNAGLRIDHFLPGSEATRRLSKAQVDKHVRGWDHTSDHAPVWIELAE